MTEKNNISEVDQKAESLRTRYGTAHLLTEANRNRQQQLLESDALYEGRLLGEFRTVSESVGRHSMDAYFQEQESRAHYGQNQAAYHEIAKNEAEAAGVQINVSQPLETPEQIDVTVQK